MNTDFFKKHEFNFTAPLKYVAFGFLIGLLFPIGSWIFDLIRIHETIDLNHILSIHIINPIHFIVDTAPFILGTTFYFIGSSIQKQTEKHHKLQKVNLELNFVSRQIIHSIDYTKHIQNAILPSKIEIKKCFPNSFHSEQPKAVIGGDYLWCTQYNNAIQVGLVDCTGHGIPGAMMTIVACLLLKNKSKVNYLMNPSDTLEKLDRDIKHTLQQNNKENSVKDGLDISLLTYYSEERKLYFSGAYQSMILFTNSKDYKIIKGTRRGIGSENLKKRLFETHFIDVKKGNRVLIYTDGLIDQFDKTDKSKYSQKRLINTISNNFEQSTHNLGLLVKKDWLEWKGETLQTDDCTFFIFEIR